MQLWEMFKEWFLKLGEHYHVNPYIFGSIYIGAIPFFFLSLTWTIKKMKQKKSFVVPLLLTGFFFVSAYLYLVLAGKNIPLWVYIFILLLIGYGVFNIIKKIKTNLHEGNLDNRSTNQEKI